MAFPQGAGIPEQENAWLKRIVADLSLDKEMLQDVIKQKISGLAGRERWIERHRLALSLYLVGAVTQTEDRSNKVS